MKKYFIAVGIVAFCAILFSFVNQPEKQKTEHKWFKYRIDVAGIPDADKAKQASNYVLVGDEPFCDGKKSYCGIFAEPTDESSLALPILGVLEKTEIDEYFNDPSQYNGIRIDRTP